MRCSSSTAARAARAVLIASAPACRYRWIATAGTPLMRKKRPPASSSARIVVSSPSRKVRSPDALSGSSATASSPSGSSRRITERVTPSRVSVAERFHDAGIAQRAGEQRRRHTHATQQRRIVGHRHAQVAAAAVAHAGDARHGRHARARPGRAAASAACPACTDRTPPPAAAAVPRVPRGRSWTPPAGVTPGGKLAAQQLEPLEDAESCELHVGLGIELHGDAHAVVTRLAGGATHAAHALHQRFHRRRDVHLHHLGGRTVPARRHRSGAAAPRRCARRAATG